MNLSWFKFLHLFPDFGDTQHVDNEYFMENGNKNPIYILN